MTTSYMSDSSTCFLKLIVSSLLALPVTATKISLFLSRATRTYTSMATLSHHEHPHISTCEIEANNNINNNIKSHTLGADIESGLRGLDEEGVSVTWEDLWVRVTNSQGSSGNKAILQGVTGYAKPGEVLAIMGPSGCGKSTLLDALAGRLGANTRQAGDILINGRNQALAYGTSAYVTQDETLITTLTVREAVYYSAQLQLPNFMSKSEKKERAEKVIRDMGLQDSANTRIGGSWRAKGLSGGQKKRVSICIDILTHPQLIFLDEPTSGLDSAASYYVMNRIVNIDQKEKRTIIVSIHQPSGEVFSLFHNLCLLSMGKTIYFGPARTANEFFASNSFPCPALQNPSDHFLKTINKDFDEDVVQGPIIKRSTEEVINILATSYKSSEYYQEVQQRVSSIHKQRGGILDKEKRHTRFLNQSFILTKRSSLNMYREPCYYWTRLVSYMGLALCMASLYFDIGTSYSSIQARAALLSMTAIFFPFMAIAGFPSFVEDMKVFEKERLNGHYDSGCFVIANTLSSLPYLFFIPIIPGSIMYYLTGLQRGYEHFIYFASMIFASLALVEGQMMAVASILPNYLMGILVGIGINALMVFAGGFFRLPNHFPIFFWRYPMYYISMHRYTFQGLYKNEFEGLKFPSNQTGGQAINGDYILKNMWEMDLGRSKWVDLAILFGMAVFYRFLFLVIVKFNESVKPNTFKCIRAEQKRQVLEHPTFTTDPLT